jgi:hypothetical protein
MFRSLRLCESFEHVLSQDEWSWFGPMAARRATHFDEEGWPLFAMAERQAYPRVWQKAAQIVREKLRDGEWVAEGISSQFGPQPVRIDTNLWDYLRLNDRVEEAEGAGFHFVALTVSSTRLPKVQVSQAKHASLRKQLTEWIRLHAGASGGPVLRDDQLAAARDAFVGNTISDSMYRECRRAAGLPKNSVQRGRPKIKRVEI